jgi:hypothetical protein
MLKALSAALCGGNTSFPKDTDWEEVVKEAKEQAILGLISPVIPSKYINVNEGGDEFIGHFVANYISLLYEQDALLKLFEENGIPCVILKGCAAAVYYPKPYLREIGDIDILVPRDRFEEAMKVMETDGYDIIGGKDEDGNITGSGRHVEYMKNGIEVELHHHFSSNGYDIDDLLETAIYRREYVELNGYRFPVLPETESGLVFIGHIRQHLKSQSNELGLRQIIDWAMYVRSIKDKEKWKSEFCPAAEKTGLIKLAKVVTALCEKYLGITTPPVPYESDDVKTGEEFLKIIFENGNFGRNSTMTENEKGIHRGLLCIKEKGFFAYLKGIGMCEWKPCIKYPVLTCFAWIYGLYRCIGKGLKAVISIKNIKKIKRQVDSGKERYDAMKRAGIED